MNGFQIFVNRPIMATAINLVLLIIGLVAFQQLELRHQPNQAKNEFKVDTFYPGASTYSVEQRVTKPLEDSLSGLDGIRKINSESMDGKSEISVKFKSHVDHKVALSELRDRILIAGKELPDNVKKPEIYEQSETHRSILYISFEDKTRSKAALSDFVRRNVEDRLKMVDGVSYVNRFGDKLYEVSVELDPARLMEHQVTAAEVVNALKNEKSFASGGQIEKEIGKEELVLNLTMKSPEGYKDVTIKNLPTHRVRVGDVAEVKIAEKNTMLNLEVDGQYTTGLQVSAKSEANPLVVVENVRQFVAELENQLPPSMKVSVVYDGSSAFKNSLQELKHTLWEAILLVGIIVTLSLSSLRAAVLTMVTIPLCLIGSFALMWILNFSVNPITLLALVLAVGLVVDDAIVVIENIHHYMEEGFTRLQAARKSMKEITFAIIVMTITLAAVYIPVALQSDDSAVMFREFAWTLAGAVLISGFVALTLTPALCGKFLKESTKVHYWEKLVIVYRRFLILALEYPWRVCAIAIVIAAVGVVGFMQLGSELKPVEDEDMIYGYIYAENQVPKGVRQQWFAKINAIAKEIPERERNFNGEWQQRWLFWAIVLKPRAERNRTAFEIVEELKGKFTGFVGPTVGAQVSEEGSMGSGEPMKVIIQYAGDYRVLTETIKKIQFEAKKCPEFDRVNSEQVMELERLEVDINKPLAQELGIGMEAIEDTLYTFLSGKKATEFHFNGLDYDVNVRASKQYRRELNGINQYFVMGGLGQWVPLGSLVTLKEILGPSRIKHFERTRGSAISFTLKPGVPLDKAMRIIEPIVKENLPKDARFRYGGSSEKLKEAKQAMYLTYALALIFIYLVLAALFESFIYPLVVLLTVPLSLTGAIWAVKAIGGTNNIYTSIGLVTLVGLITKHGILIVDFANRLRASGTMLKEAVELAAIRRLRPIIMTTLAMVFGAVPLIFSIGAGAIARHHIGWVIVGGMMTGTFFSLFVIPVVYHLAANVFKEKATSDNVSDNFNVSDKLSQAINNIHKDVEDEKLLHQPI